MTEDSSSLTEQQREDAKKIFQGEVEGVSACHFCGGIHAHVAGIAQHWQPCPRVKRVERHSDGSVLVVEHWEPGTWEKDVIFPADVY